MCSNLPPSVAYRLPTAPYHSCSSGNAPTDSVDDAPALMALLDPELSKLEATVLGLETFLELQAVVTVYEAEETFWELVEAMMV